MKHNTLTALLAVAIITVAACSQSSVGWRTDGTDQYLTAAPPLQWSSEQNIVWSVPMPGSGNSNPVIWKDRIFMTAEVTEMLCLDKGDGQIVWQVSNDFDDFMDESDLARVVEAAELGEQFVALEAKRDHHNGEIKKLQRAEKVDEDKAARLTAELAEIEASMSELNKSRDPLVPFAMPPTHQLTGYSTATPVTDGRYVAAVFGTGYVACFDVDGRRLWIRRIDTPPGGLGHSSSPLLIDDVLIVHIRDLVALDVRTGAEFWRTGHAPHFGTPAAVRIGGQGVLITTNGGFFRAADGEKLGSVDVTVSRVSPLVHGDTVYFAHTMKKQVLAVRLPAKAEPFDPEVVWATDGFEQYAYSSPSCDGELLYVFGDSNKLHAIDMVSGQIVYSEQMKGLGGTKYPSVSVAGGYVFLTSEDGSTHVVEAGRQFKVVAKNKLDATTRGSLVFDNKKMYVRSNQHLYCIGE